LCHTQQISFNLFISAYFLKQRIIIPISSSAIFVQSQTDRKLFIPVVRIMDCRKTKDVKIKWH
ncbi:MAG: hypothetical protein Q4P17_07690, partial [Methanobacterium sp.]|nr:hypothetical protein [Methanobacterium sp.]